MKAPVDPALVNPLQQLLATAGVTADDDLAADMLHTILRLAKDDPGRADMKLMLRSLKELRYAFKVFKRYRNRRKIAVFGSARTPETHPNYLLAKDFGKRAADAGFMVITGAGGGKEGNRNVTVRERGGGGCPERAEGSSRGPATEGSAVPGKQVFKHVRP